MANKLTRFTFYDMYWNVIKNAKDEEIGRFIKAVCAFVFDDVSMAPPKSAQEDYYQACILSELTEVKRLEAQGKVPKKYNQKMLHFAFLDVYYKAIKLMNDEDSGAYLKALCSYAFNGKQTSKLKPPVDGYFEFAKLKLELSKLRATSGKKGGKSERVKVTDEEIDSKTEKLEFILSYEDFMKAHPHIVNDLYQSNKYLLNGITDWTPLDVGLDYSGYKNCKSLTKILENRKEIELAVFKASKL